MQSLYEEDAKKTFEELFSAPGALYCDTPFWSWNAELDPEELLRQIGILQEMGMGGFHMHARTGLATPYLGGEFMERVRMCVEEARKRGMLAWLYDEDRWPSGSAGSLVTRDPKYRARHLLFTPSAREEETPLACYAVKLDAEGCLESHRMIGADAAAEAGEEKFYLYCEMEAPRRWFNGLSYCDTLNPEAIKRFVEVTHEAYYREFGKDFGGLIPAIFTDEPQFSQKGFLRFAREKADVILPWTESFPEFYRAACGKEFFPTVPELIWQLPGNRPSAARYRFHDLVTERFVTAFADTIGSWCDEHNLRFSGHMMAEGSLASQTQWVGEAMRAYRSFQLPGIDMLCDRFEYGTAKQAASVSRQYGRGGVLCELDGVTDWDFPFSGHKGHGDWQAALGVTVRVPHLSWFSMAGEAKRDYPASINYQSPWYREYRRIADHFARVNTAMTRGRAVVRVGVIHPIESYWLCWGPMEQTAVRRRQAEEDFDHLIHWLLNGLIDFDFISESLLPKQSPLQIGKCFIVGEMAYDVVIVPPVETLRGSTLERLEKFAAAGGRVIFAGPPPALADAENSDRPAALCAKCETVPFSRTALLEALEPYRDVSVIRADGEPPETLLYQLRQERDGKRRYCLIVNAARCGASFRAKVRFRGAWQLAYCDTGTGSVTPLAGKIEHGWTELEHDFHAHGHLLLRLDAAEQCVGSTLRRALFGEEEVERATVGFLRGPVPVTLDEPNVLLLDQAEWKLSSDRAWQPREELLRLNNTVRARLGLPKVDGDIVQPWVRRASTEVLDTLEMRFTVESRIPLRGVRLALEQPENAALFWDGAEVPCVAEGFWTDRAIRCVALPDCGAGTHELVIRRAYSEATSGEWCYLLGDFGVRLLGDRAVIVEPVRELALGDAAAQGLPFYGGNIVYHFRAALAEPAERLVLHLPSRAASVPPGMEDTAVAKETRFAAYRGTLATLRFDGREAGALAFSPWECELGAVSAGEHAFDLTLYGSRVNCFGAVHAGFRQIWAGPQMWRTQGDLFSYEYQLQPFGLFTAPRLLEYGRK